MLKNGKKAVSKAVGGAAAHIYADRWVAQNIEGMPSIHLEEEDGNRILRSYIDGDSLSQALIEMDFNLQKQGQLVLDTLRTLENLHGLGLAHGAIKSSNLILSARSAEWILVDPAPHGNLQQDVIDLARIIESMQEVFCDLRWRVWISKVFSGDFQDPSSARNAIYALGLDQSIAYATPTAEASVWIGLHAVEGHRQQLVKADKQLDQIMTETQAQRQAQEQVLEQAFEQKNQIIALEISARWDELVMELLFGERTPDEAATLLIDAFGSQVHHVSASYRPVEAVELEVAASILAGAIDESTNSRYRESIMQKQVVMTAKDERDQFYKAHASARRVADLEAQLSTLESEGFWGRGFRDRKKNLRQVQARLALARDARDSLLSKILPAYRAIFDAEELYKLVEKRLSEREAAFTDSLNKWLHFLPPVSVKSTVKPVRAKFFDLQRHQWQDISFEMRRLPESAIDNQERIAACWAGVTQVTQDLFAAVCQQNPSRFRSANRPVDGINWYEAILFCNLLSEKLGFELAYEIDGDAVAWNPLADGFRLPTVSEWLHAARSGQDLPYAGSRELDEVGWHWDNASGQSHPVKEKKPNDWGLFDCCGNVAEWCWDLRQISMPTSGALKQERSIMGGSWYQDEQACRLDVVDYGRPDSRADSNGIRLFRSL